MIKKEYIQKLYEMFLEDEIPNEVSMNNERICKNCRYWSYGECDNV
jgi:hypothetical protein